MQLNYEMIAAIPKILRDISSGYGFSTTQFSENTGISPNTIKKYMTQLKECHLLKDSFEYVSSEHKWSALQSGFLHHTLLTAEEIVMLCLIEKTFRTEQDATIKRWLNRLLSKNMKRTDAQILKKIPLESIDNFEAIFNPIKKAIRNNLFIEFDYKKQNRPIERKRIAPYKILNLEGYWYLAGLDSIKQESKAYTMANISALVVSNDTFSYGNTRDHIMRRLESVLTAYYRIEGKLIDVKLDVHKSLHEHLIRKPISPLQGPMAKIKDSDYYRLNIQVTNHAEIVPTILRHLPLIKVISPPCLNRYVVEAISKYSNDDLSGLTELHNICKDS